MTKGVQAFDNFSSLQSTRRYYSNYITHIDKKAAFTATINGILTVFPIYANLSYTYVDKNAVWTIFPRFQAKKKTLG